MVPRTKLFINEESLIGVVACFYLVVKLHIVPIDEIANFVVDSYVAASRVNSLADEVGCLWCMRKNVLTYWQFGTNRSSTFDEPVFSLSHIHCLIVFVIEIYAIKLVL